MTKKGRGSKKRAKPKAVSKRRRKKRVVAMMVISEAEAKDRSVIKFEGEGTVVFQGVGEGPPGVVMTCGSCSSPLVEGMPINRIQDLVLICPKCGAFNESLA